jgi:hypothetical protein
MAVTLSLSADDNKKGIKIHTKQSYKIINGFNSFKIDYKGDIKVSDDDRSIKSISPGGFLEIQKATFGNKRRLLIESDGKGELSYTYHEGNKELPYNPDGEEWLAETLLEILRSTGIDAEGRTKRIYKQGGLTAFIDEVYEISSNYVNRIYFNSLFKLPLNDSELSRALKQVSDCISSNYEISELLIENQEMLLKSEETQVSYLYTIDQLSSNYEKKRVISNALPKFNLNDPKIAYEFYETVGNMTSNYEKAEILTQMLAKYSSDKLILKGIFQCLQDFSSNYEIKRVMNSLPPMDLSTSYSDFFMVCSSLSSNYELKNILSYALKTHKFNKNAWIAFIESLSLFSSNYELSNTMTEAIKIMPYDKMARTKFIEATDHFTSNMELKNTLTNYITYVELKDYDFLNILKACENFSSNFELANTLEVLVDKLPAGNQEINDAFLKAMENMSSDHEYRRIMSKLLKKKS